MWCSDTTCRRRKVIKSQLTFIYKRTNHSSCSFFWCYCRKEENLQPLLWSLHTTHVLETHLQTGNRGHCCTGLMCPVKPSRAARCDGKTQSCCEALQAAEVPLTCKKSLYSNWKELKCWQMTAVGWMEELKCQWSVRTQSSSSVLKTVEVRVCVYVVCVCVCRSWSPPGTSASCLWSWRPSWSTWWRRTMSPWTCPAMKTPPLSPNRRTSTPTPTLCGGGWYVRDVTIKTKTIKHLNEWIF